MLRTGAPWRDLPERYGRWSTVYSRFRRWTASGVWQRVLEALQSDADARGDLDWSVHYIDATVVRAHRSAAGARGGQQEEALGQSRGGFSTKIHLRAEGGGKPLTFVLSGGERHESRFLAALLAQGHVRRSRAGRPRHRPKCLVGDKGYSYPFVRLLLVRRGIRCMIPRRKDQRPADRRHRFDPTLYRGRNQIERLVGRLKEQRRIATRYEKRASAFLAMLTLAALLLWL